jgi:cyclase
MLILPAIDILKGNCVRLRKGDYQQVIKYFNDPIIVAEDFVQQGATFLHVVDLDGAKQGKPVNNNTVIKAVSVVKIPVQVGGGIRNYSDAVFYLENGLDRIILGTSAILDPSLIGQLIQAYGAERIVISLDVDQEKVKIEGWQQDAEVSIFTALDDLKEMGIDIVIVTDIDRDGTLLGPNVDIINMVIKKGFKVIAAGGISTREDLNNLKQVGCYGAIIGKAIYEGKIDLNEALNEFSVVSNLTKRIIPCMDVVNSRVVKGVSFKNLRDAGDPVELGRYYSEMGADELVFLDITACVENRSTFSELVCRIAENVNIPFTVGGGIKKIKDIGNLLKVGADKVTIGTIAVSNPGFTKKAANEFGSQCIVISLDCKKEGNSWKLYIKGGRERTEVDAIIFAKQMEQMGAGELLVNSLDRDGRKTGYDTELLRRISDTVNIPVIASSGAGCMEDFLKAFIQGKADAALAASLFHYDDASIIKLKQYLRNNNVAVRI